MSCDLSDPNITAAYDEVVSGGKTNWFILGYNNSRDVLSVYGKGEGGLEEMRNNLKEEILYGFVRVDGKNLLVHYVSEQVSGVKRARALVHGRQVTAALKDHAAQITATSPSDLSDNNIRNRLKLKDTVGGSDSSQDASLDSISKLHSKSNNVLAMSESSLGTVSVNASRDLLDPVSEERARLEAERRARIKDQDIQRARAESEAKVREAAQLIERKAAEQKARDEMKKQYMAAEKNGSLSILADYICHQAPGSRVWKRRYFVVSGKTVLFYNSPGDKNPLDKLELHGASIIGPPEESVIPNSFQIIFPTLPEPHVFYCDSKPVMTATMAALEQCAGV